MALGQPELARLRALRDLRVLRGPMHSATFDALLRYGLCRRRYISGPGRNTMKCDYIITEFGLQVARARLR